MNNEEDPVTSVIGRQDRHDKSPRSHISRGAELRVPFVIYGRINRYGFMLDTEVVPQENLFPLFMFSDTQEIIFPPAPVFFQ